MNNSNKGLLKLGNVEPTRDFTFVEDTVEGYLNCLKKAKFKGEVINIGTGFEISIKNLVKIISKILNKEAKIKKSIKRSRPKKSEVERLCCSTKKAKKFLNWKAKFSNFLGLKKGLSKTIDWQTKHSQKTSFDKYIV